MAHEQGDAIQLDGAMPKVSIRVTHIRDGKVLEVFETPADDIHFEMQEESNGRNE